MRILLYLLLTLCIGVLFTYLVDLGDGKIIIRFGDFLVTMSALFFILLNSALFLLLYFVIRFFIRLFQLPQQISKAQAQRRVRNAEKRLNNGLGALLEGDWQTAEKKLRLAAKHSSTPHIPLLLAARAAHQAGKVKNCDRYLQQAARENSDELKKSTTSEAHLLAQLTQAELHLNEERNEQALSALNSSDSHSSPLRNLMRLEACVRLEHWQQVLQLLPAIGKQLSRQQQQNMAGKLLTRQMDAWVGLLRRAGEQKEPGAVDTIWRDIPAKLRTQGLLLETYIGEKIRCGSLQGCEKMLRKALQKNLDAGLLRLYQQLETPSPIKQLTWLEKLLQKHPGHAQLLLCLGQLASRNELWGKARTYLENSLAAEPSTEAFYELAKLHQAQGEEQQANECLQRGLQLSLAPAANNAAYPVVYPTSLP